MTVNLKFEPDYDCYAWDKSNSDRIREFALKLPNKQKWLEQALRSYVNYFINGSVNGFQAVCRYGSIVELTCLQDGNLKIGFNDQDITRNLTIRSEELLKYSIKDNINDAVMDNEFPKFAIIKKLAKENPNQLVIISSTYSTESLAIGVLSRDSSRIIERASINEMPLNDLEKKMLETSDKLHDLELKEGLSNRDLSIVINECIRINNALLFAKKQGSYVTEFNFNTIPDYENLKKDKSTN